ncbi:MAG: nuclear transport factor 2 family protein [Defluviicoccus sp.]|nr:nuclear transport factor 2 family protein [Defluviicoccus sp.]MDE0382424.1 nuclear transport factor 2 family protein [Defluviicoccus sp.]
MDGNRNGSLEARLRDIEDRLEIYNLIASHPPSADTGADYYTSAVYAEDGSFDRGEGLTGAVGNEAIAAMTQTPGHRRAIEGGLAHFAGLPHIAIDGDTASVTSYLLLLHPDPGGEMRELPNHGESAGFRIHRVAANRWTLARTPEGWKIASRKLRPLDGSQPARDILEEALAGYRPAQ